jgi:hypothetical protein
VDRIRRLRIVAIGRCRPSAADRPTVDRVLDCARRTGARRRRRRIPKFVFNFIQI